MFLRFVSANILEEEASQNCNVTHFIPFLEQYHSTWRNWCIHAVPFRRVVVVSAVFDYYEIKLFSKLLSTSG